jgi:hypothetical protein
LFFIFSTKDLGKCWNFFFPAQILLFFSFFLLEKISKFLMSLNWGKKKKKNPGLALWVGLGPYCLDHSVTCTNSLYAVTMENPHFPVGFWQKKVFSMSHKWWRVYTKSGGVCETFMSNLRRCSFPMSKKTIRIFAFKNKGKKKAPYLHTHKVPLKVPESISSRTQKYFSHPSF